MWGVEESGWYQVLRNRMMVEGGYQEASLQSVVESKQQFDRLSDYQSLFAVNNTNYRQRDDENAYYREMWHHSHHCSLCTSQKGAAS